MNDLTRRAMRGLVLALIVFLACNATSRFQQAVTDASATLRLDADISAGEAIQIWLNKTDRPPLRELIRPGRHTYEFPGITADILTLRIDPTNTAHAHVVIYSLELVSGDKTFARFGPDDFLGAAWYRYELAAAGKKDGAADLRATTNGPILSHFTPIRLPHTASAWVLTLHEALVASYVQPVIWLLPFLALGGAMAGGRRAHVVLVAVTVLAGWLLIPSILSLHWASVPVRVAISRAAFMGQSLRASQVATAAVAATMMLMAAIAGWIVRRWQRPQPAQGHEPASTAIAQRPTRAPVWMRVGGPVLAMVTLAFILAPDLAARLANLETLTYGSSWDLDNWLYWAYLSFKGALPYRDFWYPYAGTYLFDVAWPAGPGIQLVFDLASFGAVLWALWWLIPESPVRAWVVVAIEAIAYRLPVIYQVERYLLGPAVVVGYLAARHGTREPIWWRLGPFWLAVGLALVFDPPNLIYAGPALVVLTALDLWSAWRSTGTPRRVALVHALRLPLWACAGAAGLALVSVGWLAAHGQLSGFLELFGRLQDSVEYSAMPTPFDAAWRLYDLRYVVLFWPAALIGIGVYELMRGRETRDRRLGEAMLAMGLLAMMVLQKQLVRPLEYTMQVPLLLATLMYGALAARAATWRFHITKAAFLGLAIAVMINLGKGDDLKRVIVDGPRRLATSLAILASPEANRHANREIYAPARFANFDAAHSLIRDIRARWHPNGPLTLFALSDAASLYMLTGQPTVWQSNTYNGSPVYEQDRRVRWLTQTPPDFVVFDPAHMTFDTIANAVRVPRVISAVIAGYVPVGTIDPFDVLRRRQPNEPVPLAYWRERLGDLIDLGHLPEQLDIATRGLCAASQPCDEYLSVMLDPNTPGQAAVRLDVGGSPFTVRFERAPGHQEYVIPLSRLWISQAARLAGAPIRVVGIEAAGSSSYTARRIAYDDRRLY